MRLIYALLIFGAVLLQTSSSMRVLQHLLRRHHGINPHFKFRQNDISPPHDPIWFNSREGDFSSHFDSDSSEENEDFGSVPRFPMGIRELKRDITLFESFEDSTKLSGHPEMEYKESENGFMDSSSNSFGNSHAESDELRQGSSQFSSEDSSKWSNSNSNEQGGHSSQFSSEDSSKWSNSKSNEQDGSSSQFSSEDSSKWSNSKSNGQGSHSSEFSSEEFSNSKWSHSKSMSSEDRSSKSHAISLDAEFNAGEPCKPCLPGFGQKKPCPNGGYWIGNGRDNVIMEQAKNCDVCPPGTYSPDHLHFSTCLPCSECGDNLYEEYSCTPTSDTKCDLCTTDMVHYTQSYWDKVWDCPQEGVELDELNLGMQLERKREANVAGRSDVSRMDVGTPLPILDMFSAETQALRQMAKLEDNLDENHKLWKWNDEISTDIPKPEEFDSEHADNFHHVQIILRGLTCAIFILGICVLIMFMTRKRKPRVVYTPMVRELTDDEQTVIRRCAHDLMDQEKIKRCNENTAFSQADEGEPTIFENPLANVKTTGKDNPV